MDNPSMGIRALLVGATGLVGGHCLGELLYDNDFSAVTVLTLKYGLHGAKAVDDSAAPAEAEEAKLAEE